MNRLFILVLFITAFALLFGALHEPKPIGKLSSHLIEDSLILDETWLTHDHNKIFTYNGEYREALIRYSPSLFVIADFDNNGERCTWFQLPDSIEVENIINHIK